MQQHVLSSKHCDEDGCELDVGLYIFVHFWFTVINLLIRHCDSDCCSRKRTSLVNFRLSELCQSCFVVG